MLKIIQRGGFLDDDEDYPIIAHAHSIPDFPDELLRFETLLVDRETDRRVPNDAEGRELWRQSNAIEFIVFTDRCVGLQNDEWDIPTFIPSEVWDDIEKVRKGDF